MGVQDGREGGTARMTATTPAGRPGCCSLGMMECGFWTVAERVDLVGLAPFVLLTGAGRWSADHELGRTGEPSVADGAGAARSA